MGGVKMVLLVPILVFALAAVCSFVAAVVYFLRSPCLRRASLVSYATAFLSLFVFFGWFEADQGRKFISALGMIVIPILFLQAGMWLGFRSVDITAGAEQDGEG